MIDVISDVPAAVDVAVTAGVADKQPSPPAKHASMSGAPLAQQEAEVEGKVVVLVGGDAAEREAFAAEVAQAAGGSAFSCKQLISAAMRDEGTIGEDLFHVVSSGHIVLGHTIISLLTQQMATASSPYLLSDFPRMPTELHALEHAHGSIATALCLPSADLASSRASSTAAALVTSLGDRLIDIPEAPAQRLPAAMAALEASGALSKGSATDAHNGACSSGSEGSAAQPVLVVLSGESVPEACATQLAQACAGTLLSRRKVLVDAAVDDSEEAVALTAHLQAQKVLPNSDRRLHAVIRATVATSPPPYVAYGLAQSIEP